MKEIVNDGFAKVVKPYMDAQDKKSREIIAPVEVSPAEAAHSAGDEIIFNGILYDVIAPIAINDVLSTSGAGANISVADNIEAQIKTTKSQIQTAAAQAAAQNKNTQEMIAPVEEDETDASRTYAIGDQLILDGVLYNVIDAIAQHGIITSEGAGANIEEADDVTDQLSSLNQTLTKDVSALNSAVNNTYQLIKIGSVWVVGDGVKTYQEKLYELASALISYWSNKPNNWRADARLLYTPVLGSIIPNYGNMITKSSNVALNFMFAAGDNSLRLVSLSSGGQGYNNIKKITFGTNGNTITDFTNEVIPDGDTINVQLTEYEIISL